MTAQPASPFRVDHRIESSSLFLTDWPLCRVFLKNEAHYPWFILVPRVEGLLEVTDLGEAQSHQLMKEIKDLATRVKTEFQPDKLNIGSLGNLVPQCHIHLIARYQTDPLWPHSLWQSAYTPTPYPPEKLESILLAWP